MKLRMDFVTNSSSASFIIARKNDCTRDDIKQILLKNKDELETFVNENIQYTEYCDEFEEIKNIDEKIELAAKYLSEEFYSQHKDITIDEWNVCAREGNSESENLLFMFLYCNCNKIDEDKFKVSSGYC